MPRLMRALLQLLKFLWASPYTLLGLVIGGVGLCFGGKVRRRGRVLEFSVDGTDAMLFDEDEITRIVTRVPIATHNQRARGTLLIGTQDRIVNADTLIQIVEDGMSSEIYRQSFVEFAEPQLETHIYLPH